MSSSLYVEQIDHSNRIETGLIFDSPGINVSPGVNNFTIRSRIRNNPRIPLNQLGLGTAAEGGGNFKLAHYAVVV